MPQKPLRIAHVFSKLFLIVQAIFNSEYPCSGSFIINSHLNQHNYWAGGIYPVIKLYLPLEGDFMQAQVNSIN